MRTKSHLLMAGLLIFGLTSAPQASIAVMAQTAPDNTAYSPAQAQASPAGKFIQDLGNKAISIVTDKSLSADQRAAKYGDLLKSSFDIPAIGRFVLGRVWNAASPQQQTEFLNAFQALMVKIYGDRLSFYSGENFQVKSVRQEDESTIIVSSEISHPQGTPPTTIDWRVKQANNTFSIIDVVIEGVSQSVTQRQEYTSILERNNGDIDILIKMMRQQAEKSQPMQD